METVRRGTPPNTVQRAGRPDPSALVAEEGSQRITFPALQDGPQVRPRRARAEDEPMLARC